MRGFPRCDALHGFRNRRNVLRRIATAAADEIHEAIVGEIAEVFPHVCREQIEARGGQRIRQAGIRIAGNERVRLLREVCQKGPHQVWSQRAIQPDGKGMHMRHRIPKRLPSLRGNHRFPAQAHRSGNDDRKLHAIFHEHFLHRHQRRLGIE